jgi:hypothetical protein
MNRRVEGDFLSDIMTGDKGVLGNGPAAGA